MTPGSEYRAIAEVDVEPGPSAREAEERAVRAWKVERLCSLGVPEADAHTAAGEVDWHDVARLVEHGCPPLLALEILR